MKTRNPDALVLAHPECDENILRYSDHIGSTTSIIKFASEYNIEKLKALNQPIIRIDAKHTGSGAKKAKRDKAMGLEPFLFLAKQSRVMLRLYGIILVSRPMSRYVKKIKKPRMFERLKEERRLKKLFKDFYNI